MAIGFPPDISGFSDTLVFLLYLFLISSTILVADLATGAEKPTMRYLFYLLVVSVIVTILPYAIFTFFDFVLSRISDNIILGPLWYFIAYLVTIYCFKHLLGDRTFRKNSGARTWENSIWMGFITYLVLLILISLINILADAL